jgi:replicative DNA helicase
MSAVMDRADDDIARLRVPPQSCEAEQSVLGALLLDGGACWDRVGDLLKADDFYAYQHRVIFEVVGSMVNASRPADVLSVFDRLRDDGKADAVGGISYLNALAQSVVGSSSIRRHAEIVREKAIKRAVIVAADAAAANAYSGSESAALVLDNAVDAFDRLLREQVLHKPQELSGLLVKRIDHYNALADGTVERGKSTGLRDLDAALNGGLQDGRVYVLAARPSVGKTSLALQIADHRAGQGDGVLVLSQEMPAEECTDRLVSSRGLIDYGRLQRGELERDEWGLLTDAIDRLQALKVWIDDQPGLRLADIRGKAMSLRRQGLRLIVVDYLQLCSGTNPGKGSTRNGELEEICRGLKTLAKQLRLPILLLSQLSREVEKRANPEPTLADLRDSGAIEQDADCVLFLWRVRHWADRQVMGLGVAKNRQGATVQRIPLEFRGQYQRWGDSEADISPEKKPQRGRKDFE